MRDGEETILIFAARYAHSRKTGGSLIVCSEIESKWPWLSFATQDQIKREIKDEKRAGRLENHEGWDRVLNLD